MVIVSRHIIKKDEEIIKVIYTLLYKRQKQVEQIALLCATNEKAVKQPELRS